MSFVYLDHAATSFPKSAAVFEAVKEAFFTCGNSGRGGHPLAMKAAEAVYACREALAELFGSTPENVVITSGATAALNMAIKGLAPKKGDALCSAMEHNSVLRPLYSAFPRRLQIVTPCFNSREQTATTVLKLLKKNVGLMVLCHASNLCGICLPVKELCAEARRKGIPTVLDCAQSAGHIPVNIVDLGADIICIPAHKGLGGAMGVGALIVNPESGVKIKPLIEGGTGVAAREKEMPPMLPERLEAGTANVTGIAALTAAVKELEINRKEEELRQQAVRRLKAIKGVKVYATGWDGDYAPVVAFNVKDVPSDKVAAMLAERGIYVRGGLHCAPLAHEALGTGKYGAVRASFGRSNSEEDVDILLTAVEEIANSG